MAKIVKLDRSPKANTTMLSRERGFTFYGDKPKNPAFDSARGIYRTAESTPANENKTIRAREKNIARLNDEANRMLKSARGSKTPSTAMRIAGAVGRTAGRMAGPVGALVGMTKKLGDSQEDKPRGPLMKGNAPPRKSGPSSNLSAPNRTAPSSPPSRPSSTPARTMTASRSPSSTAPSKAAPSKSSAPSRPSSGPTSAPSRTAPSKASLGTSRFAKGGAIKRRKK